MGQMEHPQRRPASSCHDRRGPATLSSFGFRWIGVLGAVLTMVFLEACVDDTPTLPADQDASAQTAMGAAEDGTQVVIESHWLTLDTIGATGILTARVTDAAGNAVAAPQVTWASADAAIATVNAAGGAVGRVTASGFGTTKVTATYNSATAEATVEVALPLTDREILEIFYEATGGDGWADNSNWLTERDLGEWHGVGTRQGKVSDLRLQENNLIGTIPPELDTCCPV